MASTGISPEGVPLSINNSLITVRLSDVQTSPEMTASLTETVTIHSPCQSKEYLTADSFRDSTRSSTSRSRSISSASSTVSSSTESVDWENLEKTEEQEPKDEGTDESTALLLARLEQENNALATDPKSGLVASRNRSDTRPPSMHQLKKLVNGPQRQSLRYSLLPAPHMTELEFWSALVQDYPQTVQRLPTLTANKIRGGVPPPLRGVVWASIAGAHDSQLHEEFGRLSVENSPYDGLIGKDVGRSFPNVDMFREKDGEGQQMLRRVLKAFSLYDDKIGYCQGLGFVVGPLLMHMSEPEAFSVLVRLMEHYDLRSCYTPDLAGLHLRIFQFQALLARHLPELMVHLSKHNVEPLYVSQWFLSFFAVTCPLPMLLRIYDVILSEGATETLMRAALSLMQRNQTKLIAFTEFEDIMQFLLSRSLWDTYAQHADDMVQDFVALTGLVSRECLKTLEIEFKQSQSLPPVSTLKNAAASLLGRFWAGSGHGSSKSVSLSLAIPGGSSHARKMSTSHSVTSASASVETAASDTSTVPTEVSESSRAKSDAGSLTSSDSLSSTVLNSADRDLHHQIEELLTVLSKLQHQQVELARDLQREREEREEERALASTMLGELQKQRSMVRELLGDGAESVEQGVRADELISKAKQQFSCHDAKRVSIIQSKHQLRDAADEWKEKHEAETTRCQDLMRRLDERDAEHKSLTEALKEARQRIQDSHREKQRLERSVHDYRTRSSPVPESPSDLYTPISEKSEIDLKLPPAKPGLREFKLGRSETSRLSGGPVYAKRMSSLATQNLLATDNHQLQSADTLLIELVNAKTAEATARTELEETRGKLDALRKIISGGGNSPAPRSVSLTEPASTPIGSFRDTLTKSPDPPKVAHAPSASVGGFFSGWGKRGT